MLLMATFPRKVRIKCEVCEKEYLIDKAWWNSSGYSCCEPLKPHEKTTNQIIKELKNDEILEFRYDDGKMIPIVAEVAPTAPKTFEIDFKDEIKPGPRKSKTKNK